MNIKMERFFEFMLKEKTRNFLKITIYIIGVVVFWEVDLPLILEIGYVVFVIAVAIVGMPLYLFDWLWKMEEKNRGKLGKNIIAEIKKIGKEILMYIPVSLIIGYITAVAVAGKSANQIRIDESFYDAPILNFITIVIIAPIIEEFIFRFLPYGAFKNKTLYIIVSAVIFAGMHVVNDPNPFYYIWRYIMQPLYFGYRYHKTKDVLVPITLHSFNNLISRLLFIFS